MNYLNSVPRVCVDASEGLPFVNSNKFGQIVQHCPTDMIYAGFAMVWLHSILLPKLTSSKPRMVVCKYFLVLFYLLLNLHSNSMLMSHSLEDELYIFHFLKILLFHQSASFPHFLMYPIRFLQNLTKIRAHCKTNRKQLHCNYCMNDLL